MSINVTVSGSPVRINRGKMITNYGEDAEFNKRRCMRLEQVRQQSKDIAENLRSKIRKEKEKCLCEIEQEGEHKLKQWQARKLLELQNQYQEAIDELGIGHKNADEVAGEEELLLDQQSIDNILAEERGRIAQERAKSEKHDKVEKSAFIERKKITKSVENNKSKHVKKKGRSPVKKVKKKEFDSDRENQVPELNIDSSSSSSEELIKKRKSVGQQTSLFNLSAPTADKAAQTVVSQQPPRQSQFFKDTRISERIKKRPDFAPEEDLYNLIEDTIVTPTVHKMPCPCCTCHARNIESFDKDKLADMADRTRPTVEDRPTQKSDLNIVTKDSSKIDSIIPEQTNNIPKNASAIIEDKKGSRTATNATKGSKIPPKPKVTLRSTTKRPVYISAEPTTAEYYDHSNRYTRSYRPKAPHVDKVQDDDLITAPFFSEDEIQEKMRKRDVEAELRGQVALEKERIQREYQDLLKKLPALQKQERLCEIGKDKEKYHMNAERLEEMEKKRQNRLDNAYEELFVRQQPAPVTLKKHGSDSGESLNLAAAETECSRSEELSRLLSSLKAQKEDLLKEIANTASLNGVKSKSTDFTRRSKRKRNSLATTDDFTSIKIGTTISTVPSSRKKAKTSQKVLVLQNVSSQTSPLHQATTEIEQKTVCCCKQDGDVCEIIIKLKEDEKSEVTVNPPHLSANVKVTTEEEQEGERTQSSKKMNSWGSKLTQSSSSHSTTSTSYLDPPNVNNKKSPKRDKNVNTSKQLDPRLLTYIKRLLSMSRATIDDLTASSGSDVTTPSPSVLEVSSNNPLHRLRNVMKYFKIDAAELQKQLNYSSESSSIHYNSTESLSIKSSFSDKFKSCIEFDQVQHYSQVAAECNKKIENLTAMIAKVREEKKKMMESISDSERDLTSYKDLPEKNGDLDKLLEIDYDYAEKLKQEKDKNDLSNDELLLRLKKLMDKKDGKEIAKSLDEQIKSVVGLRVQQVTQEGNAPPILQTAETKKVGVTQGNRTVEVVSEKTHVTVDPKSIPVLLDIPKLPKLASTMEQPKKRPPPSKGLRALPQAPHELSTIIEADSQLSTKADSQRSSKADSRSSSKADTPQSSDSMTEMLVSIGMEWAIPTLKKTREALAMESSSSNSKENELSLREFLSKISSTDLSDSQGLSLIQVDNRRTSTPVMSKDVDEVFMTSSNLSSVKEHSEKFYDINEEGSASKTR